MKLCEYLRASVTASVDGTVSRIKSHDAFIAAALEHTLAATARARSQLTRVRKDGEALQFKLALLQQSAEQWHQRAHSAANTDEIKALQCLQRRNTRLQEAQQANNALIRHSDVVSSAASKVDHLERQLEALNQQRRLISQHSAIQAQRIVDKISGQLAPTAELDDSFDRWETRSAELARKRSPTPAITSLNSELITLENAARLKSELDTLKRKAVKETRPA